MGLLIKDKWEKVNGATGVGSKGQKRNKNRATCTRRRRKKGEREVIILRDGSNREGNGGV